METDLATLLLQGQDMIAESARAHAERWGLGSADGWSLDQRDGVVRWRFADHVATAPAQILGSWNREVGTFAWSWDNPTILDPLCETAERVRAFGEEHDVVALTASPLSLDEEQVRDLLALAFRIGGCTGLYHPFDGRMATYISFGTVTVQRPGQEDETFEVTVS